MVRAISNSRGSTDKGRNAIERMSVAQSCRLRPV